MSQHALGLAHSIFCLSGGLCFFSLARGSSNSGPWHQCHGKHSHRCRPQNRMAGLSEEAVAQIGRNWQAVISPSPPLPSSGQLSLGAAARTPRPVSEWGLPTFFPTFRAPRRHLQAGSWGQPPRPHPTPVTGEPTPRPENQSAAALGDHV